MKEHYTAQELSELLNITRQAVQKRAKKEAWKTTKDGRKRPYLAETLPPDIKKKITLAQVEHAARTTPAHPPSEVNPMPVPPRDIQRTGLDRYSVVMAWRMYIQAAGHGKKGEATQAFLLAYHSGQEVPEVFPRLGRISEKSIYRWDKQLRENRDDYLILCTQKGKWLQNEEPAQGQLSKKQAETFLQLWLNANKPSIRLACTAATNILKKQEEEPPSYTTFYRFATRWKKENANIYTLMRNGEKALKDKIISYITRDPGLLQVGDVLVADGHKLNFLIRHPQTGKPCRMQLIMFYDWASRWPAGWQLMPTEDTVAIHAAFRHACMNLGKYPLAVLLDNGKAFKAKIFTKTAPDLREFQGLYARLGVEPYFAAPYNARAKVVERFFGTFNEQFERLVPSYTGSSIGDKPAWMLRNETFHQQLHKEDHQDWVPDIREAAHIINTYIMWYGDQPHSGMNGRKPGDVFVSGRGPGIDPAELNYHFLWTEMKKPRNCRITLWGIDYESDCLLSIGHKIEVKYDTADLSRVLFYKGGRFLGEGLPVRALSPLARLFGDKVGMQEVKAQLKRQKNLIKKTQDGARAILGKDSQAMVEALPWTRKEAVARPELPELEHGQPVRAIEAEPMTEAERTRLEKIQAEAIQEMEQEEWAPERPRFFRSDWERYEWCLRHSLEYGCRLNPEDQIFMSDFRNSPEWPDYAQRAEDLELVLGLLQQKEASN